MWKSKFYSAFVLNRRVVLHAIDATPARWRDDADSSPLDGTSAATPSLRNDLVKNCRVHLTHWLISTQVSANLEALEALTRAHPDAELLLCESGGDNLAAHFSNELADFSVYVIDVAGGDKVPRKGGPGITQADVLVVNKVDLAPAVGADLDVMRRDALKMRGAGPTVFASVKHGDGLDAIIGEIFAAQRRALAAAAE